MVDLEDKWFLVLEICQREELECSCEVGLIVSVYEFWPSSCAKLDVVRPARVANDIVKMDHGLFVSVENLRPSASKRADDLDLRSCAGASGLLSRTPEDHTQII